MPSTLTYPGVYLEEIPSGVRTITGVATSITAFIGRAQRGPVNEPVTINSFADFERLFGGLWAASALSFAARDFFLNGGSQAIIVRLVNGADTAALPLPGGGLTLDAASPGQWGNRLKATVDHKTRDKGVNTAWFNLTLTDGKTTEQFLNLSVKSDEAGFVPKVLEQQSSLARVSKDDDGDWVVPGTRPGEGAVNATADSGSDGNALTATQFTDTSTPKTGIFALANADLFNLLCLPPYKEGDADADVDSSVVSAAAAYCEQRRAFLILDPPLKWKTKAIAKTDFTGDTDTVGTRSKNAALFFPRLRQKNPLNPDLEDEFAPCGAVAGIFARTDAQRGLWKAPAGTDARLVGVTRLSVPLTDGENGELNPLGLNCLRALPATGPVVWGSRTLDGADRLASEWKYIPVRRMALYLEESLYRGTHWVVFEPNDEPLWAQIRLNIGAFMHNLFRQGAFQGQTPKDAYFVKCDKETTTQTDINLGIVNIVVGFAPLKPAEFVVIRLQQMAGPVAT
jgi:phage tail sheath protein FI